ncbi:MAG: RDD family protein [Taibaiella sp.]
MEQNESSIFDNDEAQLVLASQGKRFLNLIIDRVAYAVFSWLFNSFVAVIYMETLYELAGYNFTLVSIINVIISLCWYALFMGGVEALSKGKSLGKFITGTKAVNEDGSTISPKTALLRGLSRMVPLEPFSAFGNPSYPWHDRWTRTYVIDEKQSIYPEQLFEHTES